MNYRAARDNVRDHEGGHRLRNIILKQLADGFANERHLAAL
jgi:hypothetical protein